MVFEYATNGARGYTYFLVFGLVGFGDFEKLECDLRFNRDVIFGRGISGG